ncbi:MAG: hypothetical protein APR63_10640 [Desulfuromonas sp. SDB]|nr:MAG: hypothetical protein APR63_10640 [Desulfuromonas sp. SDB]
MVDNIKEKIKKAGWDFPEQIFDLISNYDKNFIVSEFTGLKTLDYYHQRINCLGFVDMNNVLDAACGMGQWSIALSLENKKVNGIDINVGRLLIADSVIRKMKIKNCNLQWGNIEDLPYPSEIFDGIFCYGSFMFANMPKTLMEFNRVLKPGGTLYLNANSVGWYLHLLFDRGIKKNNFSNVRTVIKTLTRNLFQKKSKIVVFSHWINKLLQNKGFQIISSGAEGEINISNVLEKPQSAYPKTFYSFPAVLEILAKKND